MRVEGLIPPLLGSRFKNREEKIIHHCPSFETREKTDQESDNKVKSSEYTVFDLIRQTVRKVNFLYP